MTVETFVTAVGALSFGLVIGWVTYRTIRRSSVSGVPDIAAVIGAVGGAAVTSLIPQTSVAFASYCMGLAIGFFGYLATAVRLAQQSDSLGSVQEWLGEERVPVRRPSAPPVRRPQTTGSSSE